MSRQHWLLIFLVVAVVVTAIDTWLTFGESGLRVAMIPVTAIVWFGLSSALREFLERNQTRYPNAEEDCFWTVCAIWIAWSFLLALQQRAASIDMLYGISFASGCFLGLNSFGEEIRSLRLSLHRK